MYSFSKNSNRMGRKPLSLMALLLGVLALPTLAQPGGSALGRLSGDARPQPLPLAEAFPFYVAETAESEYRVTWTPAPGHYLYRHAFAFSLQLADSADPQPLEFSLPPGLPRSDQFFGDIEAYYDDITAIVALPDNSPATATLIIEFQGCADWGFCYPPQRQDFSLAP